MLAPALRVPNSTGLRSGPRIFISNTLLGEADASGPGTTLDGEPLLKLMPKISTSHTDTDPLCLCGDTDGRTCHLLSYSKDEMDSPAIQIQLAKS